MADLDARERFLACMRRAPGVRAPLWEFGYWTATVERWYAEGLPRSPFSPPMGAAPGNGVFGDALPFPHMPGVVRYRDVDVHRRLGFDEGTVRIPVNWRMCPAVREVVLEEDETTRVLVNGEGVTLRVRKDNDSIPQYIAWPVHDRASWEKTREERFAPHVAARFPARWETLAPSFRRRDFPLGIVMDGFFASARELLGVENQLVAYHEQPDLMIAINEHLCGLWLAVLEDLLARVDLDFVHVWEDMSFKTGPLVSPAMFARFILPYYRRVTAFLRGRGVDLIFVDTDGRCTELIPGFIEGGVAGMYPFEVQAGMDVVEVRARFPGLLIQGGLDKTAVARGKAAIDAELAAKLPVLLRQGGYVPFCDHLVPPDVPWENFVYYRERVRSYVERFAPG